MSCPPRTAVALALALLALDPRVHGEQGGSAAPLPFDQLVRRASEAWQANDTAGALRWYGEAVARNPAWDEGWWYLGSIHYGADRYAEARDAFSKVTQLKPEASAAWALLALSEYELKDFDAALAHLVKWQALGPARGDSDEIRRTAALHLAMLLVRKGQFDLAMRPLTWLATTQQETPLLLALSGLVILERAVLPEEVPASERECVIEVGRGAYAAFAGRDAQAKASFEQALGRCPNTRGLRFAYGLTLSRAGSGQALPVLRQEVELFPDDVRAHVQIALEFLNRGKPAEAIAPAREAVRLAPALFSARLALGRALSETDALAEGIAELERAAQLAPEVPDTYLALARAYARSGRTADVERVRAKLLQLEHDRSATVRP